MGRLLAIIGMAAAALVFGIAAHGITNGWKQARLERAVEANAEQIFRSPSSIVAGNPAGDVSVVVFYDANCPYCREGAPALAKLIANDGQVRLVLKQLPVLGPDSEAVARVMLAAARQGKSFELYERLLAAPAPATKDKAMRIAGELGLDTARLEQDAQDPAITERSPAPGVWPRPSGFRACPITSSATGCCQRASKTSTASSPRRWLRSVRMAAAPPVDWRPVATFQLA